MNENLSERSATLKVQEAANLLGVSRWTIYEAVTRGELQAVRIGRSIRIAREPLEERLGLRGHQLAP